MSARTSSVKKLSKEEMMHFIDNLDAYTTGVCHGLAIAAFGYAAWLIAELLIRLKRRKQS